jgi:hypothetical protein
MPEDGWIWFQASHSQSRVCQEGCVKSSRLWHFGWGKLGGVWGLF